MKFFKLFLGCILLLLITACTNEKEAVTNPQDAEIPETQIIADPPFIVGHVVGINTDKQVIMIAENISKEEALNSDIESYEFNVIAMNLNHSKIEGKLAKGNLVGIWKVGEGPEKSGEIVERVIVLEK